MKNVSPWIINVAHAMPWWQRWLTWTGTAALWGFWISLWKPVITRLIIFWHGPIVFGTVLKTVNDLSPVSLPHAFFALVGTSTALLLWTFVPGRVRTYHHRVEVLGDYARHFHLDEQEIALGRQSQVCTVHHDDHGAILGVEINKNLESLTKE